MKRITRCIAIVLGAAILFWGCKKEKFINEPGNLVQKTVDQDPSLPSITVNGAQLHAEAYGPADSSLIIVMHGGPGSDYRYLLNCKAFAANSYRVVFYDQRGTGLSQRFPYACYTMELAYADLSAVIAHYRTSPSQKVFLLGHSWGAMLATAYINQNPDVINGTILCEPGGFVWNDVEDYIARSRKLNFFSEDLNDAVYMEQFITGRKDEHAVLDYKFGLWAAAEDATSIGNEGPLPSWRGGAVTFNAYFDLGTSQKPDWTGSLKKYTTPVLFIYSENNEAYGLQHAQKVSSAYPHVQLFRTNGAGHDMLSFPTGWNNTYLVMLNYLNSLN